MEISGKIFKVLPKETGEGKNGTWTKQSIVIETPHERYPKKVCVALWGDLVTNNTFTEGVDISLEFDIESREFNGKWYTDVKAWRINKQANTTSNAQSSSTTSASKNEVPAYTEEDAPAAIEDDLPF
ncbi:MAG TPA: DUF3127 domain-containing protein [Chitinophagales bacterium]|jgi:hypothetical protein|nr:DUF3127 domain-containing protein [Chitinophagales bacterium]MBP6153878.1 DUF3127 domain-containing protein [Chitinophagales bacterium]HQV79214.1 DUF3127 domain-containing protein [Chitinophagales bacterium]HQW80014.1 DUF3127 domain-containing protein [Chitinophagales bacterium]HRB67514.1 DUF3127 domain-containing protein [Chitinophagales bacterium]